MKRKPAPFKPVEKYIAKYDLLYADILHAIFCLIHKYGKEQIVNILKDILKHLDNYDE